MGTVKSLLLGMCFVLGACTSQTSTVQTTEKGTQWEWQNGTIVVKTPERPAGQKSVLGLTTPKLEAVRVGFVGLGMRGPGAVERFTYIPGTQVVALCDYEEARADKCQELLKKASMPKAAVYSGDKGYEVSRYCIWNRNHTLRCFRSCWKHMHFRRREQSIFLLRILRVCRRNLRT